MRRRSTGSSARSDDDAGVVRRARDLLAAEKTPGGIENAKAAPAEAGGHDPAVRLLDVVRVVCHRRRLENASVGSVNGKRSALPAGHVGAPAPKGDVLRR